MRLTLFKALKKGKGIPRWHRAWRSDPAGHWMDALPVPICWAAQAGWELWLRVKTVPARMARRWPKAPKGSPVEMRLDGLPRLEYELYGAQRFAVWLVRGFLPRHGRAWTWCGDWLQQSWWGKFFKGMGRPREARTPRRE